MEFKGIVLTLWVIATTVPEGRIVIGEGVIVERSLFKNGGIHVDFNKEAKFQSARGSEQILNEGKYILSNRNETGEDFVQDASSVVDENFKKSTIRFRRSESNNDTVINLMSAGEKETGILASGTLENAVEIANGPSSGMTPTVLATGSAATLSSASVGTHHDTIGSVVTGSSQNLNIAEGTTSGANSLTSTQSSSAALNPVVPNSLEEARLNASIHTGRYCKCRVDRVDYVPSNLILSDLNSNFLPPCYLLEGSASPSILYIPGPCENPGYQGKCLGYGVRFSKYGQFSTYFPEISKIYHCTPFENAYVTNNLINSPNTVVHENVPGIDSTGLGNIFVHPVAVGSGAPYNPSTQTYSKPYLPIGNTPVYINNLNTNAQPQAQVQYQLPYEMGGGYVFQIPGYGSPYYQPYYPGGPINENTLGTGASTSTYGTPLQPFVLSPQPSIPYPGNVYTIPFNQQVLSK